MLGAPGGDDRIVIVVDRVEVDVRFARNEVTTNGSRRDRRVVVASLLGRSDGIGVGVAARSGPVEPTALVETAREDAKRAPAAEDASELVRPGEAPPAARLEDPPGDVDLVELAGPLGELREALARARGDPRGYVLAGFLEASVETVTLATSAGLRLRHEQPACRLEIVARTPEGASSWAGAAPARPSRLDLAGLERRVLERLAWSSRRVELPAGRYEALLPPDAVADLVVMLDDALSGRDAEDGRSAFSAPGGTRVGERLSPLPFELRGDPAESGLACCPFVVAPVTTSDVSVFDNGLAIGPTRWIADGRLERLRYHRARARSSGTLPTPPVDNLVLELPGADASLADLVARTERGLLLTCLWYLRELDPTTLLVTGVTRDGVYLVERGEVTAAVNNFRFNESPLGVLARATEAGRCAPALSREWGEWMPRTAMPPLRVPDFNCSSPSPAT